VIPRSYEETLINKTILHAYKTIGADFGFSFIKREWAELSIQVISFPSTTKAGGSTATH